MNMPERVRANTNTQALPKVWLTGKEVSLSQVYVPRLKRSDWTLYHHNSASHSFTANKYRILWYNGSKEQTGE